MSLITKGLIESTLKFWRQKLMKY